MGIVRCVQILEQEEIGIAGRLVMNNQDCGRRVLRVGQRLSGDHIYW